MAAAASGIEERLELLERCVSQLGSEQRRLADEQEFQGQQFSEFTREERDFHETILCHMKALADWFQPGPLLSKLNDLIDRVGKLERS